MKYDPLSHVKVVLAAPSKSRTSSTAEVLPVAGVDRLGWNEMLIIVNLGTIASTGTFLVRMLESASASDAAPTAISGASFPTSSTYLAANNNNVFVGRLKLDETRLRYIYCDLDCDNSNAVLASVTFVLFGGKSLPPTQQNTAVFSI